VRLIPVMLSVICGMLLMGADPALPAAPGGAAPTPAEIRPVLEKLGVVLKVTERPRWPTPPGASVTVTLAPQVEAPGSCVVSFGLPFPPGILADDRRIRVRGADGREVAAFTRPLARWWIDRRQGTIRSALVQFEMAFPDAQPRSVTVTWDRTRSRSRAAMTPIAETQVRKRVEAQPGVPNTVGYEYACPQVLALLPPEWLCASLLVWQQTPAPANTVAPWYDRQLMARFAGSLPHISAVGNAYESHLFDRTATYVKIYARHGQEAHWLAALKAGDFYIQHLGEDGFFDIKPTKDHKYVYTEGPALLYMLTGDERYRQAIDRAIHAWESHTRIEYHGTGFWTERHHGFGMMAYLHAYEISGDTKLLDKAQRFFEAALALQIHLGDGKEPDGSWAHTGESHGEGEGWITSPWMSAFLADSIWKYWMLSGDARAPASLAMVAKFIERYAVTPNGKGIYYLATSPGRGKLRNPEEGAHNMEGIYFLAMGYYLSGGSDAGFREKIAALWPPMMEDDANRPGRRFTWRFRETSMLVWFLAQAGAATK
jgi:hypothetical protein